MEVTHSVDKANQSHTHHKIAKKIEAINAIKLQVQQDLN